MESLENLPSRIYSSWISVLLLAAVLGLLYRHFTVTFDHFHKLGVPFMKPVIILGNPVTKSVILATKSIFDYHVITYNHFKGFRMGGIFEGRRPMLMIRDPELVKAVLVKDFDHFTDKLDYKLNTIIQVKKMLLYLTGNEWKSVRSIITPSFSSAKLRSMEPLIEQCCVQMTDFLKQRAANDTEVEMKFFACRYTLDVIGSCAFGLDCASLKCPDAKFVKMADDFMEIPTLHRVFFFSVMMLCPSYIPYIPVNMFNEEAVHYLRDVIIKTMKDRENNPSFRREDFVQLMLDTSKKEKSESGENVLTDVIIQAQAMIFFMAGFETSSALLSFACATLALLPDIQDRLRKDIQEAIENGKGRSYFEIINEIPLLEQVLLETMRMYPSVPRLERVCTKPYTIPGSDVKLNLGDIILIPVAGIMNNPKYYPNPEVFNPGRFSEAKKTKPTEVYLPFGVGPRHCLGMRFAMLTTKIYMFYLLKEFKLNPSEKTQLPFAFHKKSYLLKAEKGLWVNVVPLDKC